jgi:hypothetical protein
MSDEQRADDGETPAAQTWQQRLRAEHDVITWRRVGLDRFASTPFAKRLPFIDKLLISLQLATMWMYSTAIELRLKRAGD